MSQDSPPAPQFDRQTFILITWHCWEGVHELCDKAECMCQCHEEPSPVQRLSRSG